MLLLLLTLGKGIVLLITVAESPSKNTLHKPVDHPLCHGDLLLLDIVLGGDLHHLPDVAGDPAAEEGKVPI